MRKVGRLWTCPRYAPRSVDRSMATAALSNSVIERGCLSRKTVNGLGVTFNEAAADTSMDFGRRMLAKFGWTEGKGLGRQENGMLDHIRVKQRADQLGLGAQEREITAWAPPPDAIAAAGRVAKKAASKKAKAKAKARAAGVSDSDSESDGEAEVRRRLQGSGVLPGLSDDALFELCGGARLHRGSRGGTGGGKLSRTEEADRAFLAKYGDAVSGMGGGSGGSSTPAAAAAAGSSSAETAAKADKARRKAEKKRKAEAEAPAPTASSDEALRAAKKGKRERREEKLSKSKGGEAGKAAKPGKAAPAEGGLVDSARAAKKAKKAARRAAKDEQS